MVRVASALAMAALALSAAACGSNGGTATGTTTPAAPTAAAGTPGTAATVVVAGTPGKPVTPTPQSSADKTAIAVGANVVQYDLYTDPGGRFSVEFPHGWALQVERYGPSVTLQSADSAYPASAVIGVLCLPGATVDTLVNQDRAVLRSANLGDFTLDNATPTTVGGVPARDVRWQGAYMSTVYQHLYTYFEAKGCAWRIAFSTYPNVSFDAMRPVRDHVVQSFKLLG